MRLESRKTTQPTGAGEVLTSEFVVSARTVTPTVAHHPIRYAERLPAVVHPGAVDVTCARAKLSHIVNSGLLIHSFVFLLKRLV